MLARDLVTRTKTKVAIAASIANTEDEFSSLVITIKPREIRATIFSHFVFPLSLVATEKTAAHMNRLKKHAVLLKSLIVMGGASPPEKILRVNCLSVKPEYTSAMKNAAPIQNASGNILLIFCSDSVEMILSLYANKNRMEKTTNLIAIK